MTLGAESPEAKAVHDALGHRARPWDSLDEAEREFCASVAAAVLAAAVPTDGKTLSREFDEDGRALCFQCGEPQSAHPDGEECEGREYARGFAAGRAAAPSGKKITHGRHCICSACAAEDWTNPNLAPCGMHGSSCPREYAPLGPAGRAAATPDPPDGEKPRGAGYVFDLLTPLGAASPDERLREAVAALPQYVITIQDREGYTYERGCEGQPMNYTGVMLADVEALVGGLKDRAPTARETTDELKDSATDRGKPEER